MQVWAFFNTLREHKIWIQSDNELNWCIINLGGLNFLGEQNLIYLKYIFISRKIGL